MEWIEKAVAKRVEKLKSPKFGEIAEIRNLIQGARDVIDLGYGEPDFNTPEHIREAAKKAMDEGYTHYVLPVEGLTELREAVARKLLKENNINADPSAEILVTAGVQEATNVAVLSLIDPGDEVILPEPYYYSDPLAVMLAGGTPVYTQLKEENDYRLDLEDLESKITSKTKAIFYISPNCPTGAVFPEEDLKALAALAKEKKLFIITDEIYEKLVYDGQKHCSIASFPDARELTISMFGFSKAYAMTGWRIGFLHAPAALVKVMLEVHGQLVIGANSIAQKAAVTALIGPQDCVEEMRRSYEERRNVFVEGLNHLGFSCKPPQGSFYIYANISKFNMTSLELAKLLAEKARVIGYPGTAYTKNQSGDKYLRFAYTKDFNELKTALERIEKVVSKL